MGNILPVHRKANGQFISTEIADVPSGPTTEKLNAEELAARVRKSQRTVIEESTSVLESQEQLRQRPRWSSH